MANKQIVFADHLVGLSVQNGLVRLDLAVNGGQIKDKDGKTGLRLDVNTQLVMPLEAFVNAVAMQQKAMQQVVALAQKGAGKAEAGQKDEKPAKADKKA